VAFSLFLPDVADTRHYKEALKTGIYNSEIFFNYIQMLFKYICDNEEFVIALIQIFIVMIAVFTLPVRNQTSVLVVLFSVPLFLALQNGMRQGIASIFMMYAINRGGSYRSLGGVVIAQLFHRSSILFALLSYFAFFVIKKNKVFFSICYGMIAAVLLGYFVHYTGYDAYLRNDDFSDTSRVSAEVKVFFIVLDALIIYFFTQKDGGDDLGMLKVLLLSLVSFMFVSGLLYSADELVSRVMFFYFFVSMYLIINYINRFPENKVYLLLYNFLRTAFAINVHTILAL